MSIDLEKLRRLEESRGDRLVGDLHSHPGVGAPECSGGDARGWGKLAAVDDVPYVGVILGRSVAASKATHGGDGDLGWLSPEIRAWIIRREGDRQVCEPAEFSIERRR